MRRDKRAVCGGLQLTTSIVHTHKFIRRDVSCQELFFAIRRKSLRHKEINIELLSHFRRIPTSEIFEIAAPKPLRRKEFGKIGKGCRIEPYPSHSACLR
jgi:hypothetical protein